MILEAILKPARGTGEAFGVYKMRRKLCQQMVKARLRGTVVHSSRTQGTLNIGRNADKRRKKSWT